MEADSLLTRTVFAEVPPRVEYALTPLGDSLRAPIRTIIDWAENNVTAVVQSRAERDSAR